MSRLSYPTAQERYDWILEELEILSNRQPLKQKRRVRKWRPFVAQRRK